MSPATEYLVNTSLTLGGVVVLAWLLVYVARRWERNAPAGPLQLLGTLRLDAKRAVYLVRVGERVVALGASEGGMVKVCDLAPGELGDAHVSAPSFSKVLERLRGEPAGGAVPRGDTNASPTASSEVDHVQDPRSKP